MSHWQFLFEILSSVEELLRHLDTHREASKAIEWLLLSIQVGHEALQGLQDVFIVDLSFGECRLYGAILANPVHGVLVGVPFLVRWLDALLDEEVERFSDRVPQPLNEGILTKTVGRAHEIFHLILHYRLVIIPTVEAKNAEFPWLISSTIVVF